MYHHGYGYAHYSPYSPAASTVPAMGNDCQLYWPEQCQYLLFPSLKLLVLCFLEVKVCASVAADRSPLPLETANGNSNGIVHSSSLKVLFLLLMVISIRDLVLAGQAGLVPL